MGYKKHTLRLWWRAYTGGVLLIPLVSWVAPANVSEGGLLVPSLHYCARQWSWWPAIVVADMGYLAAPAISGESLQKVTTWMQSGLVSPSGSSSRNRPSTHWKPSTI